MMTLSPTFKEFQSMPDSLSIVIPPHSTPHFLFATVSSHLLTHDLRHLSIGMTQSDVDRQLEDLVAISDLAAGALGHLSKVISNVVVLRLA